MSLPPFQALLDAHGRDVHRFLVASVGRIDADDCYQETWLAALRAYPRLRDDSNLRAWVFTVAHRKALDHVRARRRRPVPVAEAADSSSVAIGADPDGPRADPDGPRADPDGPRADPDGQPELWAQVRRLPPKQRTAIALRFIVDASYEEVGQMMRTSKEAARRNVHEGLKRLRTEFEDDRV